jgi:hypothetical protein
MRHVGSPVFAVVVCRKFATAAAFSWHLPHHKKMPQRLIAGDFEIVARAKNAQNCFLYRLLLAAVASTFGFQTDEIETEFLYDD